MKTSFLLSVSLLISSLVFSQTSSRLKFVSDDGQKFMLYIDGKQRTSLPVDKLDLPVAGKQVSVKIVFADKKLGSISQQIKLAGETELYIIYRQNNKSFIRKIDNNDDVSIVELSGMEERVNEDANYDLGRKNGNRFISDGQMCSSPSISEKEFIRIKAAVDQKYFDSDKTREIKKVIDNNCMLAQQVAALMKLIRYNSRDQLEIAKYAYLKTYNTTGYEIVIGVLKSENYQSELREFVSTTGGHNPGPGRPPRPQPQPHPHPHPHPLPEQEHHNCSLQHLATHEFDKALQSIKASSFEQNKMEQAKLISKNTCFSIAQIREIIKTFSFEESKMDFAKFAYNKTHEKDRYYLINQEFSFESSKTALTEYINEQN